MFVFARLGRKVAYERLKAFRGAELSEVPQNLVQELTAMCLMSDYDHARFREILVKLLQIDKDGKIR